MGAGGLRLEDLHAHFVIGVLHLLGQHGVLLLDRLIRDVRRVVHVKTVQGLVVVSQILFVVKGDVLRYLDLPSPCRVLYNVGLLLATSEVGDLG